MSNVGSYGLGNWQSGGTNQNNGGGSGTSGFMGIHAAQQGQNSIGQNNQANAMANSLNQTGAAQGGALQAQGQGQAAAFNTTGNQMSAQGTAQSQLAAGQSAAANQSQQGALGLMASAAQGNQPSVAQQQQSQGINAGIQAQVAAANSARGGPQSAASAAQGAALQGGNMQAQAVSQNAALRAQEMATAQQNYGSMANSMQSSAQQGQSLGQQQQMNGQNVALQGSQVGNQEQQAGANLQQGYAQLGTNVEQDQLQADTATSQMNAQTAQANAKNNTGILGGLASAASSAVGGMMGSDARMKTGVQPQGLGAYINSPADKKTDIAPQGGTTADGTDWTEAPPPAGKGDWFDQDKAAPMDGARSGYPDVSPDPQAAAPTYDKSLSDPNAGQRLDAAYDKASGKDWAAAKDPRDPMVDNSGRYDWSPAKSSPTPWKNDPSAWAPGSEDDRAGGATGTTNLGGLGPESAAHAKLRGGYEAQEAGRDALDQIDAGQEAAHASNDFHIAGRPRPVRPHRIAPFHPAAELRQEPPALTRMTSDMRAKGDVKSQSAPPAQQGGPATSASGTGTPFQRGQLVSDAHEKEAARAQGFRQGHEAATARWQQPPAQYMQTSSSIRPAPAAPPPSASQVEPERHGVEHGRWTREGQYLRTPTTMDRSPATGDPSPADLSGQGYTERPELDPAPRPVSSATRMYDRAKSAAASIAGSFNDQREQPQRPINSGLGDDKYPRVSSDERGKTDRQKDEVTGFLDTLKPFSYRYKDPKNEPSTEPNGGRYLGVMAQNLEVGPTGKQIVKDTPRGKVLETNPLVSALAAGTGSLHERLSRIEQMVGRRR